MAGLGIGDIKLRRGPSPRCLLDKRKNQAHSLPCDLAEVLFPNLKGSPLHKQGDKLTTSGWKCVIQPYLESGSSARTIKKLYLAPRSVIIRVRVTQLLAKLPAWIGFVRGTGNACKKNHHLIAVEETQRRVVYIYVGTRM